MSISNRITLDAVRHMPLGDLAAHPAEQLALLQDEAGVALKGAKTLCDRLDGALALKYGDRAAEARRAAGKDTGTVRFEDGAVIVVADLPKKVEWDQVELGRLVESIAAQGEDPDEYVEIAFRVPERKYAAWPGHIRTAFEPARTVKTGRPAFRLVLGEEG